MPKLVEVDGELAERLSSKRLSKRLAAIWPHLQGVLPVAKREEDRNHFIVYTLKAATADPRRLVLWARCQQCRDLTRLELPPATSETDANELATHFVCPRCANGRADGASPGKAERSFTPACVACGESLENALHSNELRFSKPCTQKRVTKLADKT